MKQLGYRPDLCVEAVQDGLPRVFEFIESILLTVPCSEKERMQLLIAVEEIYVNIAKYAYGEENAGVVCIMAEIRNDPPHAAVRFKDEGTPWNPLLHEDPDIDLPTKEREPGGLGIFMAKKLVTVMEYECLDGQNILTLTKNFYE